jgi:serine/threonine protein kinase
MKKHQFFGITLSRLKSEHRRYPGWLCFIVTTCILFQPTSSLAWLPWARTLQPAKIHAAPQQQILNRPLESISLKIGDEIREAQELLDKSTAFCGTGSDCQELQRLYSNYKNALEILKRQKFSDGASISGAFKAALLGAIQGGNQIFPSTVSVQQILNLVKHMETQLPQWRAREKPILPFPMSDELIIGFYYHRPSQQLLIQTRANAIGQGASKNIFEVFTYPNWERLAIGTPRRKLREVSTVGFPNEQKIFQILSRLPQSQGLVETIHADQNAILQRAYSPVRVGSLNSFSGHTQLKLLEQVSEGVLSLHQNEICHGDIKEENLLMSRENEIPEELVLTDFDLSFSPRELILASKKRPFRGTLPFIAPEVIEAHYTAGVTGWYEGPPMNPGKKLELQIKTALKADVFSLASMAAAILTPNTKQWFQYCSQPNQAFQLWRCQQLTLPHYFQQLSDGPYQSLNQVLIAALEPNPIERIDSHQFLNAIRYLRKKAAPQPQPLKSQIPKKRSLSNLLQSLSSSASNEAISSAFRFAKPGTYFMNWHTRTAESRLIRFSFVDSAGQLLTYLWEFNPARPELIEQEIEFLKSLGRIRGEPLRIKEPGN